MRPLAKSDDDYPHHQGHQVPNPHWLQIAVFSPEVDVLLVVASFLDLRFKTEHICQENMDTIKAQLQAKGMGSAGTNCITPAKSAEEQGKPTEAEHEPLWKKPAMILKKVRTTASTTSDLIEKEMESYLSQLSPLLWFKVGATHYPILSVLAKKYLAVSTASISLMEIPHTPVLLALFHPTHRREAQVLVIAVEDEPSADIVDEMCSAKI